MFSIHELKLSEINGILVLGQIAVFLRTYAEQTNPSTRVRRKKSLIVIQKPGTKKKRK
jgi:hypothetical protein